MISKLKTLRYEKVYFTTGFFFLLIGCVNIDTDKDVMPEAIEEIVELSQTSPEHLNLILEI